MDGLLRSIAASGDGRTPETAMVVTFLGVRSRSQGLMRQSDRAGGQSSLYFDVSLPMSRSPFRPPPR